MKKNIEIESVRIPQWALPYLINGDLEGITEEELQKCNDLEQIYEIISAPNEEEPFFAWSNDMDSEGAMCFDCDCIRRV